jgi:transcriptional regulator with XRE-family HTH domain
LVPIEATVQAKEDLDARLVRDARDARDTRDFADRIRCAEAAMDSVQPTTRPTTTLGQRLRQLREHRGLSLRQTALRLECDHTLVLRWESGEREPSPWDLVALGRFYGQPVSGLLNDLILPSGRRWSSRRHSEQRRLLLGERLLTARRNAALSPWEVTRRTGIPTRRIIAIEHGRDPSLFEMQRLGLAYATTVDELLSRAPAFEPHAELR